MAKGSASRKRRITQSMDKVVCEGGQQDLFTNFMARTHLSTRWPRVASLSKLDLEDEIMKLCSRIGATSLFHFKWNSYPAITSEFLSSYKFERGADEGSGTLIFRIGNQAQKMTIAELNEALGFPADKGRVTLSNDTHNAF